MPALESVPERRSGERVFRDTRIRIATVFENLQAGAGTDDITGQYDVTREQNSIRTGICPPQSERATDSCWRGTHQAVTIS